MKKVFSLLLVVAMLLSMSTLAFAAKADMGMKATITETDTDITVAISVSNVEGMSGFTSLLVSNTTTLVPDSYELGEKMVGANVTEPTTKYPTKFVVSHTDKALYFDATETVVLTYKVTKNAGVEEISAADFAWQTGTLTLSKVVANDTITSKADTAQFTVEYVDDRAPAVEEDKFINDEGATGGTTLTFYGRIGANWIGEKYGVIVEGKDFYGALPGDTISDGNDGVTTFEFDLDSWNGTFEIVMTNITDKGTAGEKTYQFFVGENVTEEATVVVE